MIYEKYKELYALISSTYETSNEEDFPAEDLAVIIASLASTIGTAVVYIDEDTGEQVQGVSQPPRTVKPKPAVVRPTVVPLKPSPDKTS